MNPLRVAAVAAVAVTLAATTFAGVSLAGSALGLPDAAPAPAVAAGTAVAVRSVPRPAHTIVVIMENHSYSDIIGNRHAPYLNALARSGALFTHSFAITHPSEPNYLALFSGSTHGVRSDSCPHALRGPNLATELAGAHDRFVGYSEGLPARGFTGCAHGEYARKHNPWVNFADVPRSANQPITAMPKRFAALPTVSFVIPNLIHDMHDGTIAEADRWLKQRLGAYVRAARHGNGLVVITWDEDDFSEANQIPTIMIGAGVRPGHYPERIDHYTVLRTLEAAYRLKPIGHSADRKPILDIWKRHAAR